MPSDRVSKNLLNEGWTIRHHDGTKSQITKDLFGEGYTIRHDSGAKAKVSKKLLSDDWMIQLPGGRKATLRKGFLSDNWTISGSGVSGTASKNLLNDDWTIRHDHDENAFAHAGPREPPAPARPGPAPIPPVLEPGDPVLHDFERLVTANGLSRCLYLSGAWRSRSPLHPRELALTPLAITRSGVYWYGFEQYEQGGLLRRKKHERRPLRTLPVHDIRSAEVSKGGDWPASPSYELALDAAGDSHFHIQHPEAVSMLREVVAALRAVGVETSDRHDIFWSGGGDPYFRPE